MDDRIYCLFDRVAVARTGNLVLARSDAIVVRLFEDLLREDDRLGKHADDYEMRRIGLIADDGSIVPESPVTIATGSQWRAANYPAGPTLLSEAK